jgi:hypothetical protein
MMRILNYATGNEHERWAYWIILLEMIINAENIELYYWKLSMMRILNYTIGSLMMRILNYTIGNYH